MNMQPIIKTYISLILSGVLFLASCSKNDSAPPPVNDPCAGKTIIITATPTSATACTGGSIEVIATGSTAFTYKLNRGGVYQSSGTFTNVLAGTYDLFAKDGGGCEKSTSVTIQATGTAGPLFTEVKNLLTAKCQSCHNSATANGGMNWQMECNIVTNKTRIKVRAVDEGTMPPAGPLSQAEKDKITNWINAGGGYNN